MGAPCRFPPVAGQDVGPPAQEEGPSQSGSQTAWSPESPPWDGETAHQLALEPGGAGGSGLVLTRTPGRTGWFFSNVTHPPPTSLLQRLRLISYTVRMSIITGTASRPTGLAAAAAPAPQPTVQMGKLRPGEGQGLARPTQRGLAEPDLLATFLGDSCHQTAGLTCSGTWVSHSGRSQPPRPRFSR